VIERKQEIQQEERAVIVGVVQKGQTELQVQEYLDELAFLAETAGAITVKRFMQKLAPIVKPLLVKANYRKLKIMYRNGALHS
jgi:50S ribosomal subunit-associated GTPase HflX